MFAPDPRHPRRSQADLPLIGLSEFGRPPLNMDLRELLEKTTDTDFRREMIGFTAHD
jgi:hypothetical protein